MWEYTHLVQLKIKISIVAFKQFQEQSLRNFLQRKKKIRQYYSSLHGMFLFKRVAIKPQLTSDKLILLYL